MNFIEAGRKIAKFGFHSGFSRYTWDPETGSPVPDLESDDVKRSVLSMVCGIIKNDVHAGFIDGLRFIKVQGGPSFYCNLGTVKPYVDLCEWASKQEIDEHPGLRGISGDCRCVTLPKRQTEKDKFILEIFDGLKKIAGPWEAHPEVFVRKNPFGKPIIRARTAEEMRQKDENLKKDGYILID